MDLQSLSEFASTPLGQFLLVGLGMLLVSRGYPALVARWPGLAPYLGLLARLFPDAAPRSGEALWELYRTTMRGKAANGKPLPAWQDLGDEQRTAYDLMAAGLALAPPQPAKPSDKAPPGVAMLAFVAVSTVTACGSGPIREVENLAHSARDVADVAEACSFAAKEAEMAACIDDTCKAKVLARYSVIADALDAFAASWCAVSPDSEGCK